MLKNYKYFKECSEYPVSDINIILDSMTPELKIKIFDLTEEKTDIQLALYELSKNPIQFKKIIDEVKRGLYFYHQD